MNGKLLSESELAQYAKGETLIDRLRGLLDHQKENWETVRKNYDLLNSVQIEEIKTDNSVIKLQVNPERIRSTAAEVNHNANANDCFLCEENLPQNQRLLKYYKEYNFLVNPFPIFPEHFTVAKTKHTPQALFPYLNDMLLLSRDVGERYVVFYNGPKCGASIPSHHHFQIVNKEPLPIYNLVNSPSAFKSNFALENKKITVRNFSLDNRIFLHLESNDAIEIMNCISIVIEFLKVIHRVDEEPMLNLLSFYENKKWSLVLFMRRKHRPDFYYMTGERQMLVSPAAIDMAGLIILPREEDVVKLKEENILQMYREVSITKELNEYLITKLKAFYT
jgi:ATP adenylyltransferase/5',5'''-P-1,P-4-tetraphosphate phosphorylase II